MYSTKYPYTYDSMQNQNSPFPVKIQYFDTLLNSKEIHNVEYLECIRKVKFSLSFQTYTINCVSTCFQSGIIQDAYKGIKMIVTETIFNK